MPLRNVLGIFGGESIRLLRENWENATLLAEELFAIFTGIEPINIPPGSTLQPSQNPDVARLTVPNYTAGDLLIDIPGHGSITITGDGITFTSTDGEQSSTGGRQRTRPTTSATSIFPGKVVSGTGATYTVAVYLSGLSSAPTNKTVTQLQIDASATVPVDSWVMVGQSADGTYFMQYPVWG